MLLLTMDWPVGEAAFVTGAASGIGLGIARALVAAGARVALADTDGARLAEVAKELTAGGGTVVPVALDVSDAAAWKAAADDAEAALGPISILCNNAGVNGEAQFIAVSTFLPRFLDRGGRAHIMNTASTAGIGLSMVLRDELQGTDVGVSLLCAGSVATEIVTESGRAQTDVFGTTPDPDRVAAQALEAMQNRQFLIVTRVSEVPAHQRETPASGVRQTRLASTRPKPRNVGHTDSSG